MSQYSCFQLYKSKQNSLEDDGMEEQNQENNILVFENIFYDVKSSTGDDLLILLNKVNGAMMDGRMCASMGSSGP